MARKGSELAVVTNQDVELRAKCSALRDALCAQLVDRDAIVEGMLCAAMAGEHVLLLGPPGTAKSALANAFTASVDGARVFSWLLSKFTVPEELFGPPSLPAMREERYRRVTTGKLPECEVAFLDEIFKSNSAILNSLLTAINERKFHNDGGAATIPLRLVIGASNELPEGPELAALYDRFLVRYWVDYVRTPDDFVRVVMSGEPAITTPVITLADWDAVRDYVRGVAVTEDTARTLYRLRAALEKESIRLSDRRWKKCVRLLQANAWLSGAAEVWEDHFAILSDALWDDPEQRTVVAEQVQKVAATVATEALRVFDAIQSALATLGDETSVDKLASISKEAVRAKAKLTELRGKARTDGQRRQITKLSIDLDALVVPVRARVKEAMGLS